MVDEETEYCVIQDIQKIIYIINIHIVLFLKIFEYCGSGLELQTYFIKKIFFNLFHIIHI